MRWATRVRPNAIFVRIDVRVKKNTSTNFLEMVSENGAVVIPIHVGREYEVRILPPISLFSPFAPV